MDNVKFILSELVKYANQFISDLGANFEMQTWMMVLLAALAVLVFIPAAYIVASIALGFKLQEFFPQYEKGMMFIASFVAVFIATYIVLGLLSITIGRAKVSKRNIKPEDVLIYKAHTYELPKMHYTKKEYKAMNNTLFEIRKKIRKYTFSNDVQVHIPEKLDEKTRSLVIKLKEYMIAEKYHLLSADQRRLLINKERLNAKSLQQKVQLEMKQEHYMNQQQSYASINLGNDNVFLQKPDFNKVEQLNNSAVVLKYQPKAEQMDQQPQSAPFRTFQNADLFFQNGMSDDDTPILKEMKK